MDVDPKLLAILQANDELELSLADLEPAPVPEPVQDPVPPEASQPAIPPPATEGSAPETPRRRCRKGVQAARVAGENGNGAPDLASVFLTIPQVAALFHMHPGSVWRLVCEGRLPAVKPGTRLLIPAESVQQLIEAKRVRLRPWAMRKREAP